jgi:integrase
LLWSDIDFEKSTININKTTQYVAGTGIIKKSTKTDTSNRLVYIVPTTLNILKQYQLEMYNNRLQLGSKWLDSNRVFTTDYGADMNPDTQSQILERIIKRHKLDSINFHGLRHTSISLQIASGVQAQIISKRAGHSSLATTYNIYSHFFESGFQEVANKMDKFLHVSGK